VGRELVVNNVSNDPLTLSGLILRMKVKRTSFQRGGTWNGLP